MKRINLCMSGGRTSAYMVENILELNQVGCFHDTEFVITFANTGREHPKTLEFVNNCDLMWRKNYANKVVWLEAVVHDGKKPCSHKVVDFDTADRDGDVFEEVVAKYSLPNGTFLHCTRELKENPIMSYMESLGEKKGHIKNKRLISATYETWIGIRQDEPKRLNGNIHGKQLKHYPLAWGVKDDGYDYKANVKFADASLITDIIVDKQDVLDFWETMPFNLELPEHLGNCVDCHKKSFKKLKMVYNDMGEKIFHFTAFLDNQYSTTKAQVLDGRIIERKRFRGYKDTKELIGMFKEIDIETKDRSDESGGCSESCEAFMESNEPESETILSK